MKQWTAPQKPIDYAEEALVTAILDSRFAAGSYLPGERDLATELGITRPTLREALRRLERDGWLSINQGKPTRVNDIWIDGGPNIMTAIVRYKRALPAGFVLNLLEVRQALAPLYTHAAIANNAAQVAFFLRQFKDLKDQPALFADFDWKLHHLLTVLSEKPVYTLILNGFAGFYEQMARHYFALPAARETSRTFYKDLLHFAEIEDPAAAAQLSRDVMRQSLVYWQALEAKLNGELKDLS